MSLNFSLYEMVRTEIHCQNITNNLTEMAHNSGIYEILWRPNENGCYKAKDIIYILKNGIRELKENKNYYKRFDSENGCGIYEDFVSWLINLLEVCEKYPNSEIETST